MPLVRLRLFKFEIQTIHFSPGLWQSELNLRRDLCHFSSLLKYSCVLPLMDKKYSNYF